MAHHSATITLSDKSDGRFRVPTTSSLLLLLLPQPISPSPRLLNISIIITGIVISKTYQYHQYPPATTTAIGHRHYLMSGKGKGAEKKKSFRLRDSAVSPKAQSILKSPINQQHQPSIDDSAADDCSSQCVEDVLEPTSADPIYIKNRDGETYIPSPTDVGFPSRKI